MDVPVSPPNGHPSPLAPPGPAEPVTAQRRELPLRVAGRTYLLVESMNAYCRMEMLLAARTSELVLEAAAGGMRATRALLWAHLQARHGEEFPTLEHAGNLVDGVGLEAVWQQLQTLAGVDAPAPAPPMSRQVRRARARKAAR